MPPLTVAVPTTTDPLEVRIEAAHSIVFVGANGGGKTRLGSYLEEMIPSNPGTRAHRIAAQRALKLNSRVTLIDYETAEMKLLYGLDVRQIPNATPENYPVFRRGNRWHSNPTISPLDDFEAVLQALFADEGRNSVRYRQEALKGNIVPVPTTRFDRLKDIWHDLLPHRTLVVLEAALEVVPAQAGTANYDASELSDGERVIFYLIAQSLLARDGTVLIIDEPELHIHRAIMSKLWDAIESARPDCAFVYLTHDLEFAASRTGARKFALRNYFGHPTPHWEIEAQPIDETLPEETIARIMGSRRPVLFVEGDSGSLDAAVYRRAYADWTVIPTGGCDAVIHSVVSLRAHAALHRISSAGIIDADGRNEAEMAALRETGVHTLSVSEVENLFLLPDVFTALAMTLGHIETDALKLADSLMTTVFQTAVQNRDGYAIRQTKRRIDRSMKGVGLAGNDLGSLQAGFSSAMGNINVDGMHSAALQEIDAAIASNAAAAILAIYDNKGLLAAAAKVLSMNRNGLEEHIGRMLKSDQGKAFREALAANLPKL